MKNTFILLGLALLTSITNAQYKAERESGDFTEVSVGGGIDLIIEQGESNKIIIEAKSKENIDLITTNIVDNKLIIGSKAERIFINGKFVVYVTMKEINNIQATGGSDVNSVSLIKAGTLELKASGGSDIELQVEAQKLTCKSSGGSDILLSGKADNLDASAQGGSDIKASGFEAGVVNADASGGSDIYIHAVNELTVNASGGSDVYYSGNPHLKDINTSGGSDLSKN